MITQIKLKFFSQGEIETVALCKGAVVTGMGYTH
jgi:hypothetical protein